MSKPYYYIERDGEVVPATLEEWAEHSEKHKFVQRTHLLGFQVITIFDGVVERLYSTGVFPERWPSPGTEMIREWSYRTREAALRGHARIVEAIQRGESLEALE